MSLEQSTSKSSNLLSMVLLTKILQICVLDEPSNFLDREALGGLAIAIRDWAGAVVSIQYSM